MICPPALRAEPEKVGRSLRVGFGVRERDQKIKESVSFVEYCGGMGVGIA